jgi:hypothetical protein
LKVLIRVILLFGIGYIAYWCVFSLKYSIALDKQNDDWVNNELKSKLIKGRVNRFSDYDGDESFHILEIKNGQELLTYGIYSCHENEAFRKYVRIGDSVFKDQQSLTLVIIKKSGHRKSFLFPICH